MTRPKALVFGHTGQDGYFLWKLLVDKGFSVTGISSKEIQTSSGIRKSDLSILSKTDMEVLVKSVAPDHIYYLSAFHNSSQNLNELVTCELYRASLQINVDGLLNVLNAVTNYSPLCKVFYASSSHIFGDPIVSPQDELHPKNPSSPYGQSKALGMEVAHYYSKRHGVFCSNGILYNHESSRRNHSFLSKKISSGIAKIVRGDCKELCIGSLESIVDWSHAIDVVEAMHLSLTTEFPMDFIISSGEGHTVREFLNVAFQSQGLSYTDFVVLDQSFMDKTSTRIQRVGNPNLIKRTTGWNPKFLFRGMVEQLMLDEIND